jgi:hypothetical protein
VVYRLDNQTKFWPKSHIKPIAMTTRTSRAILSFATCSLLCGCAAMTAPNSAQIAAADYGQYPTNYREIVDEWMRDTLYDPHSVVDLEITPPEKYFLHAAPLMGGGTTYGYRVQVKFNAKNRMGGYTGRDTMYLVIRNGSIVKSWKEGEMIL